uniref:40S ribosomal protein S30 n=1 Tax=Syphacia muris TaxID=451379 RepID=A0A0N5ADJ5_9BILA
MQILVNGVNGEVAVFDVTPQTTLKELRNQLEATTETIWFGTRILDNEHLTLLDYDLQHGSTLNINTGLLGGKVHGSLARAGKVRAQTPKVEKQEKKKKKTGRAARRIQYNRRFVNIAVSGPGRKRGPNSNAA